jgi:hypothetical protein
MLKLNLLYSLIAVLLLSCGVIKGKSTSNATNSQKTSTTASDNSSKNAGSVSNTSNQAAKEYDWYKTTLHYLSNKRDTAITNVYPATIIYEGGKGKETSNTNTTDSSWQKEWQNTFFQKFDSLAAKLTQSTKTKETKELPVLIMAFSGVLLIALGYFIKAYRK